MEFDIQKIQTEYDELELKLNKIDNKLSKLHNMRYELSRKQDTLDTKACFNGYFIQYGKFVNESTMRKNQLRDMTFEERKSMDVLR
jgi:hypothetical protein